MKAKKLVFLLILIISLSAIFSSCIVNVNTDNEPISPINFEESLSNKDWVNTIAKKEIINNVETFLYDKFYIDPETKSFVQQINFYNNKKLEKIDQYIINYYHYEIVYENNNSIKVNLTPYKVDSHLSTSLSTKSEMIDYIKDSKVRIFNLSETNNNKVSLKDLNGNIEYYKYK